MVNGKYDVTDDHPDKDSAIFEDEHGPAFEAPEQEDDNGESMVPGREPGS
jgi:hypothetical protein